MQTPQSKLFLTNKTYVMGIDEVGLGCLAGPVYVCAFKAPKHWFLEGLRDSKKLTPKKREELSKAINDKQDYYGYTIQHGSVYDIDAFGIYEALHNLYFQAVMELGVTDTEIFVDGKRFKEDRYEYTALVGGDDLVQHISAASVLAKVSRDQFMVDQDRLHPEYNWKSNKGYGSKEHLEALKKHGVSPLHRRSYEPVKSMVKK